MSAAVAGQTQGEAPADAAALAPVMMATRPCNALVMMFPVVPRKPAASNATEEDGHKSTKSHKKEEKEEVDQAVPDGTLCQAQLTYFFLLLRAFLWPTAFALPRYKLGSPDLLACRGKAILQGQHGPLAV